MSEALYREFYLLRWPVWILGTLGVSILMAIGLEMWPASGWLLLGAIWVFFLVQHLGAIHRMNRILLTENELVIGPERFTPSDFDFSFGVQPPLVLTPGEEHRVEGDWPLHVQDDIHIAGGSWGRRRRTSLLLLRDSGTGRIIVVCTRHPRRLDALLTAWLEDPNRSTGGRQPE